MLLLDDLHGLIVAIDIVPSRCLVLRVTSPQNALRRERLILRPVDSSISPRRRADRTFTFDEAILNLIEDGLEVRILVGRTSLAGVQILSGCFVVLPIVTRHAELFEEQRLAQVVRPGRHVGNVRLGKV